MLFGGALHADYKYRLSYAFHCIHTDIIKHIIHFHHHSIIVIHLLCCAYHFGLAYLGPYAGQWECTMVSLEVQSLVDATYEVDRITCGLHI